MKLLDIYAKLKKDIAYIERELEQSVRTDHAFMTETSLHLLKAGGKRIRPVFVLLAGQFGNYSLQRLARVAVALELIHMATLVHDDVIDDADTRRGQLTVKSKWDNRIAMYTGDYIFAKALSVITRLSNPRIHQTLSRAIVQMCLGEMEQIRFFFNTKQTVRDYLLRIRRKTALLIAISCELGAVAADAPEPIRRGMYSFGYNVGMAFQIRDDILDICGTERELGKPPGSDIKQGNITLPFIFALRDPKVKHIVQDKLAAVETAAGTASGAVSGEADITALLRLVRDHEGLAKADQLAARYIEKAIHAISNFPNTSTKQSLTDIAHFIGSRSY